MKRLILLLACSLWVLGLYPQVINFEDLPDIVRQDMLIEEEDFQDIELQDSISVNSEVGYYKGSQRSHRGPAAACTYAYPRCRHLWQVDVLF